MRITPEIKKRLIFAIPLIILFYFADNLAELYRMTAGQGVYKLANTLTDLSRMLDNPLPSLYPYDLLFGLFCASVVLMVVTVKGKKAKKFRQDVEYGSARWSA